MFHYMVIDFFNHKEHIFSFNVIQQIILLKLCIKDYYTHITDFAGWF